MSSSIRFLLVNPWIHDFAAFNLWLRPFGLLELAAFLKGQSASVDYIDLTYTSPNDVQKYGLPVPEDWGYGQGRLRAEVIPSPAAYQGIRRHYRCFGLPENVFKAKLKSLQKPTAVLLSSSMTYWYPGVARTIDVCKEVFHDVPVIIGGVYATLCEAHARANVGADIIVTGAWSRNLLPILDAEFGFSANRECDGDMPYAANDLYDGSRVAVMRFTRGCPFHCGYCACRILDSEFRSRDPERIANEIAWNIEGGRTEIALYDDALLVDTEHILIPALERVIERRLTCNFHTPNGLHTRFMDRKTASLFFSAGFKTVRLSFESVAGKAKDASDGKVEPTHLDSALDALWKAGYRRGEIEVYMLVGLPEQTDSEVVETAQFIHNLGGIIRLAEYSPVPRTFLFEKHKLLIKGLEEPLLHNCSIAPGWAFDIERMDRIKQFIRGLNEKLRGSL